MNENSIEMPIATTVGEILRNARTTGRRKREIQTIAKQLCIREEFLQALEDGDYSVIPEVVYVLGFARNYAMELGLDPDDIVNKLKRELGIAGDCMDETPECTKNGDGASCLTSGNAKEKKKISFKSIYGYVLRHWKWSVAILAGVLILLTGIIIVAVSGADNADTVQSEIIMNDAGLESVTEDEADSDAPEYNVKVRERFGTDNRADARIILQSVEESWVKVEDGKGDTVFSRVLVPGDVYYVPVKGKLKATFGNAGGIDIWVDGKLAPKQGDDHVRKAGISLNPETLMEKVKAKDKTADKPKEKLAEKTSEKSKSKE